MGANRIEFMVGATYDVLPALQNLSQWVGEDGSCKLCMGVGSLKHILAGCKTSPIQGRYIWRHNQVLKSLACLFEKKLFEVNFLPDSRCSKHQARTNSTGRWGKAKVWRLLDDAGRQLQVL